MKPRCPRCDGTDVTPSEETLFASDETVKATHECSQCHTRFRFVPPSVPFNPPRLRGAA